MGFGLEVEDLSGQPGLARVWRQRCPFGKQNGTYMPAERTLSIGLEPKVRAATMKGALVGIREEVTHHRRLHCNIQNRACVAHSLNLSDLSGLSRGIEKSGTSYIPALSQTPMSKEVNGCSLSPLPARPGLYHATAPKGFHFLLSPPFDLPPRTKPSLPSEKHLSSLVSTAGICKSIQK